MDYQQAYNILNLTPNFTLDELKKAYHIKCLQYHPDKNKDGEEMFKQSANAYAFLVKILSQNDEQYDSCDDYQCKSYKDLLTEYIEHISTKFGWDEKLLIHTFTKILFECQTLSFELFKQLSTEKKREIYGYISKYNAIFHLEENVLEKMRDAAYDADPDILTLYPSLNDLFENNIYKLNLNGETYFIPLWHSEVDFNNYVSVKVVPDLSSNISIDEENNIHVDITRDISSLLNKKYLVVSVANTSFEILTCDLLLREKQIITLSGKGIARINTTDMFKIDDRGDVFVTLFLHGDCRV